MVKKNDHEPNGLRIVQFKKDFADPKIAGMNFKAGDIVEIDPITTNTLMDRDPNLLECAPEGLYMDDIKAAMTVEKTQPAIPPVTPTAE